MNDHEYRKELAAEFRIAIEQLSKAGELISGLKKDRVAMIAAGLVRMRNIQRDHQEIER